MLYHQNSMNSVKTLISFALFFFSVYSVNSLAAEETAPVVPEVSSEEIETPPLRAQFSGVFRMWGFVPLKPSGVEYQSQFRIPQIDFGVKIHPTEKLVGVLKLEAAQTRDLNSDRWDVMVDRAYLDFLQVFGTEIHIRYGLIPNSWLENQSARVNLEYASRTAKNLSDRLDYIDSNDQGVSFNQENDRWGWSFAVVNGEGEKSDEQGSGKEVRTFARWSSTSDSSVMAQWTEGTYEKVGPESTKRRLQLLAKLDPDVSWGGQVELFWGVDPVDAINLVVADKVDLTDRGGETAHSFGYSGRVSYSWRDLEKSVRKYQAFARYDYLNPMRSAKDRALAGYLLGFSYFPARNLQFSLAMSQVEYEENHNSAVGDAQEINFATTLEF